MSLDCTGVSGAPFSRKSAKCGVVAARQGLDAAKHYTLQRKASKTLHKGMDGSAFGPGRRERIAFLRNSVKQDLGAQKQGSGAVRQSTSTKKVQKWEGRKRVWTAQARADHVSGVKRPSVA